MSHYNNYSMFSSSKSIIFRHIVNMNSHNMYFKNGKFLVFKNFAIKNWQIFWKTVIFGNIRQIWHHLAILPYLATPGTDSCWQIWHNSTVQKLHHRPTRSHGAEGWKDASEDNKWMIVQCATFSKSLNHRNIDKSVSDIRVRIRFPFESSFWISVFGCKLTILPDIQPANRMVIISGTHLLGWWPPCSFMGNSPCRECFAAFPLLGNLYPTSA